MKPYIFFKNTGDINAPPGLPPKFTPTDQPDVDFQRKGDVMKLNLLRYFEIRLTSL